MLLVWAAVEKEAFAVVWSLNKFRTWIFGAPITIFADCNPLTYLTASAPQKRQANSLGISATGVPYHI